MQKNNATLSQNEKVLLALKNFKFDSEEEDEKEEKEASYSNYDDSEKKIGNNQEEYEAPSVNSSEFNAKPILESKYPKLKRFIFKVK